MILQPLEICPSLETSRLPRLQHHSRSTCFYGFLPPNQLRNHVHEKLINRKSVHHMIPPSHQPIESQIKAVALSLSEVEHVQNYPASLWCWPLLSNQGINWHVSSVRGMTITLCYVNTSKTSWFNSCCHHCLSSHPSSRGFQEGHPRRVILSANGTRPLPTPHARGGSAILKCCDFVTLRWEFANIKISFSFVLGWECGYKGFN